MWATIGVTKHLGSTIVSCAVRRDKELPSLEEALEVIAPMLPKNVAFPAVLFVQGYNDVGYPSDYLLQECII